MKKESNILLYLFAALYLIVHFVPDLDGADVMGAQWLYTGSLDLLVLGYILFNFNTYKQAITGVFSMPFAIVYSLFLIWSLSSYFYALNQIEALVCLARLISTFLIFMNLSVLLYKKDLTILYKQISLLASLVLLYDALTVISGFANKVGEMSLDSLVLSLMGNNGNKNVMAASLLIKFPFAIYYILNSKVAGKAIGILSLFVGVFALFLLNTRSTFVGLILIMIIFTITTIYFKRKSTKQSIAIQLAFFLIPITIAFFSANMVLSNAVEMQGGQGGYGTVTKRLKDINVKSEEGSRIHLWKAAIDYFKKHPFKGDGYGNWKLASIPYEKEFTNDLFVPYHSHNDFLETFADLGIVGGVLYIGLFLLALLFTIRIWRNSQLKQYHLIATISFLAVTCYFVDAFLNFPTERTSMQTMFAFSMALVFAPYHFIQAAGAGTNFKSQWLPKIVVAVALVLIVPTIYINNQVYKSLKVQKYVMGEIDADPKMALADVKDAFPPIPNLSTSTLPIPALVARYYFRDKQYDDAMRLLNESENINPYLHYTDFIKTAVFASQQKFDSVSYYSKRAFYNWPRATSYYKNVIFAAARKKDTAEINKAFATYVKYRNEPEAWNQYLLGRFELMGPKNELSLKILDSALKLFPKDTTTFVKIKGLFASGNTTVAPAANDFTAKGIQAFQKGQFASAAQLYIKAAAADPNNYTHYENIGVCFYSAKQFEKAVPYFDRATQFAQATSGKSEFFKAMCLINLGKKDQACSALQAAKQKNYPGVDQYIASNCK